MPDLKLIKNPGYVYDLMFVFYCKYNIDLFPEIFEAKEKEMEYFAELIKRFEPISDDLYLFFRSVPCKRCFFTVNYFNYFSKDFTTEYDLSFVQKQLGDYGTFIKNVIKHYFDDLDDGALAECAVSQKYLFEIIKKSNYDDKLKAKLYEFFIDPESYIRLLQYELMAKDIQLSSYYERNYAKVFDVYNDLSAELLTEKFSFLGNETDDSTNQSAVYLSFCLLNKNLVWRSQHSPASLYLLGIDYLSSVDHLKKRRIDLIPEQFGSAMSDANRVKMLDVILQKGDCTCKELETALGLASSTTYHHVSTLERCGVVKARIAGKSLYYSIDRKYFEAIINYLKRFAETDENR